MPSLGSTSISNALALAAAHLALVFSLPCAHAQGKDKYYEPDFDKELFARESLLLEPHEVTAVVSALAALAANFPDDEGIDHQLRAKALAIALRLGGTHPKAVAANMALRRGTDPPTVAGFTTTEDVAEQLWTAASYLESPEMDGGERVLQFCLVDIARVLDPTNLAESNRYPPRLPKELFEGWSSVLRDSSTPAFEFPPSTATLHNDRIPDEDTDPEPGELVEPIPGTPTPEAEGSFRAIVASGDVPGVTTIRGNLRPGGGTAPLAIVFADEAGATDQPLNKFRDYLISALTELYGSWPKDGGVIVLTTEVAGQGDESLTLPGAILADSLVRGHTLDERTLAIGLLAPEGSLVAADHLYQRLHSLKDTAADLIIAPEENLPDLYDMLLLGDLPPFFRHQIMIAGTLEEAVTLAAAERDANLDKSLHDFKNVQEAAKESKLSELTSFKIVQEELAKIVALNPRHASASALLKHGAGELPKHLTRNGSLGALYRATGPVAAALQKKDEASSLAVIGDPAVAASARSAVAKLLAVLDPETRALGDTMAGLLTDIQKFADMPSQTSPPATELKEKIFATWETVRTEFSRLKDSDG